jgi:hypothetical protein
MTRAKCADAAAWRLLLAMLVVVAAVKFDHPLAAGLAWLPIRWAIARIIWAVEAKPKTEDWGQNDAP